MNSELVIQVASQKELHTIKDLAKKLDLDCEDLDWSQFIIVKRKGKIIGFGRLRKYSYNNNQPEECFEIATVGVIDEERKRGIGSIIVKELIKKAPSEVFITCVIPDFFKKLGFHLVKQYPSVLQKKVDFCISYDYKPEEVFVMRFTK